MGPIYDVPPGFVEITVEEFAQSGFFTWSVEKIEFRQVVWNNKWIGLQMFYMNHGDNYVMSRDYWAKKVLYFKFAQCFHDYREISAAEAGKPAWNCYHYTKCSKCGHQWEYDSSG